MNDISKIYRTELVETHALRDLHRSQSNGSVRGLHRGRQHHPFVAIEFNGGSLYVVEGVALFNHVLVVNHAPQKCLLLLQRKPPVKFPPVIPPPVGPVDNQRRGLLIHALGQFGGLVFPATAYDRYKKQNRQNDCVFKDRHSPYFTDFNRSGTRIELPCILKIVTQEHRKADLR